MRSRRIAPAAQLFPRTSEGTLLSRPSYLDGESPYLLTGFTACSICNGAVGGSTQLHGTGPPSNRKRVTFYGCVTHKKRGKTICTNDIAVRTGIVDHVLLGAISEALERIIEVAVEKAIERLRAGQERNLDRRTQIERELSLIESRLGRLVEGITSGGPLDTLVAPPKRARCSRSSWPGRSP